MQQSRVASGHTTGWGLKLMGMYAQQLPYHARCIRSYDRMGIETEMAAMLWAATISGCIRSYDRMGIETPSG